MYITAKGQRQDDGSYVYTCGACNGTNNPQCSYCYGLDMDKMLEAFAVARGQQYYSLLKAILSVVGKDIYESALELRMEEYKFRVADLIYLCIKFNFPKNRVKPLVEWLEETGAARAGLYSRIQAGGFKPMKAWDIVLSTHPRLKE
jgi:hypothetical protein